MFNNPFKLSFAKVMEVVFFTGVTAGAVVGTIAGVTAGIAFGNLMAPKSGKDLRDDIAHKTGELTDEFGEAVKKKSSQFSTKANKILSILNDSESESV